MHPAIIGTVRSLIDLMDAAMGQIPRSAERISSFTNSRQRIAEKRASVHIVYSLYFSLFLLSFLFIVYFCMYVCLFSFDATILVNKETLYITGHLYLFAR